MTVQKPEHNYVIQLGSLKQRLAAVYYILTRGKFKLRDPVLSGDETGEVKNTKLILGLIESVTLHTEGFTKGGQPYSKEATVLDLINGLREFVEIPKVDHKNYIVKKAKVESAP